MRRLLPLALALLALAWAGAFPERAIPFEGKTLAGGYLKLAELLEKGPVFLNFWATHCPPCLAEGPELGRAYARYRDRVQFVAVDVQDDPRMARFRVKDWGWDFPVVIDYYADVARAYRVRHLPTSFFIAPSGEIVAVHVGLLILRDAEGRVARDFLTPNLERLLRTP